MIKRVKKTCSLILLTAAITSIIPTGMMNIKANAAVSSDSSEQIDNSVKNPVVVSYLQNNVYPGCKIQEGNPIYVPLVMNKTIADTIATNICSSPENLMKFLALYTKTDPSGAESFLIQINKDASTLVQEMVKNGMDPQDAGSKLQQLAGYVKTGEINNAITLMNDNTILSKVIMNYSKTIISSVLQAQYSNMQIPIYPFAAINGTTVKDKGYFVGGNIGATLAAIGKPVYISNNSPITDDIKNTLLNAVKKNLGAIIQSTGIKDMVDDVTDAVDDLSDSLGDLADSLHDKSDDVDDAWDKVFDRFDNDPGWGKRDGYIYYYDEDGISLKGPHKIDGKTYYFNRIDGAMETGWQIVDGKKCYFDKKKGYELFSQWVQDGEDWYFLSADGAVEKSKWLNYGVNWYYLKADGKMAKDWMKIDDYWYYFNPGNGAMASSQWILDDDNNWRYVKANGAAANNWENVNGTWYYFKENSAEMQTGWFRADGSWYYADSNGAMQTGWVSSKDGWCYLDTSSGKMKKNEWAYSNGHWYYFNVNGIMVTGKRYIDGTKYVFNSDGTLA